MLTLRYAEMAVLALKTTQMKRSALAGSLIFAANRGAGSRKVEQMDERRRFPRTEVNEPAYISSGGSVMHCTVRNISFEGCAIEVDEPAFVPPQFRLVMANEAAIVRNCQIAWIQKNRIGLTFVEALQSAPREKADVDP